MERKINFANNLRELRKGAGYTQKQLADVFGVDQRTISVWEKGICEPSFEILVKICEFFNESVEDVLF